MPQVLILALSMGLVSCPEVAVVEALDGGEAAAAARGEGDAGV